MYNSMKRLEIQTLIYAGISHQQTALLTGVSPRTVARVGKEEKILDPEAQDLKRSSFMGRPSPLSPFKETIERWLLEEPRIKTLEILERLREEGYQGSKSPVYALVRKLRPPLKKDGVARFEAVPGEFSQHDHGSVRVTYQDGSQEVVHFFCSVLKYSRLRDVVLVPDEKLETTCHALVQSFSFFGGVPLLGVFDNPKIFVTKHEGKHVDWNPTFAQFAVEAGFCPMACWPYHPQEKGAVENLVGHVKSSFFKVNRFKNRKDMERRLKVWLHRINEETPSRATGQIPRHRHLLEVERLRPLGISPEGFHLRFSRVIRSDGYVEFDGYRYFATLERVGQTITVFVGKDKVILEVGGTYGRAVHPRVPQNGKYSILPFQRGELHAKKGARPYTKRQLLMDLCPAAHWVITELRHRMPERWEEEIDRMYRLLEIYGDVRMAEAMIQASREHQFGWGYLHAYLSGQAEVSQ
jgi:transposase